MERLWEVPKLRAGLGEAALSRAMMKSLGRFAETGDPNAPVALGVTWPTWPATLLFDATPTHKDISVIE